jgi:HK97 family phage major capsid protein
MADNYSQELDDKVVREVTEEVKKLGDSTKKRLDSIEESFKQLKDTVDKQDVKDPVIQAKVDKLASDVSIRHEEMTKKYEENMKKMQDNMDAIEAAIKRKGGHMTSEMEQKEREEAVLWMKSLVSVNSRKMTPEQIKKMEPDIDAFRAYKSAFIDFVRQQGDERQMTPDQHKALSIGVDPDGGFTVTPFMSQRIIQRMWEVDPVRQLGAVETITTNSLEIMVDIDETGAGWETETKSGDETTTPDFKKKRIDVFTMYARPRSTQQLLDDSGINVEAWLADKIANKFLRVEGAAFISGDGIGKPRGMLTYANGTGLGIGGFGTVEQVNMGAAATLTADGLINLKYALVEYYLNRGTFLMNRLTMRDALKLKDGEGDYLWKPGLQTDPMNATLLSLPVRLSPSMPTVAAGAMAIILADFQSAYQIVDRMGITVQRDPYTVKPFVEFYTRKRVGGDVVNFEALKIGLVHV